MNIKKIYYLIQYTFNYYTKRNGNQFKFTYVMQNHSQEFAFFYSISFIYDFLLQQKLKLFFMQIEQCYSLADKTII